MSTFKIDFGQGFDVTESPADEFNIELDLSEIAAGGELGGNLDAPTVDVTHAGSAHHAQAHTVASHSDTTGTGAELEELTDGSETTLHSHAGGGGGGPTTVYKTADETVNNSETLQDDDHLQLTVLANEVWGFHLVIHSDSHSSADIRLGWTVPSGCTINWHGLDQHANALNESGTDLISGGGLGTVRQDSYGGTIIVAGTGGTVKVQWAQNSAMANDAKLLKGCFMIAWKLA
jgi:hypothetical protein